ncbi:hypothetical protein Dip518_000409 [Parelusimicrobium proximum]|uniref:hypothetical protein n=1 Tax=Parelusimicrobium proximum TaxID=3228953 RepID=UPI003D16ADF4
MGKIKIKAALFFAAMLAGEMCFAQASAVLPSVVKAGRVILRPHNAALLKASAAATGSTADIFIALNDSKSIVFEIHKEGAVAKLENGTFLGNLSKRELEKLSQEINRYNKSLVPSKDDPLLKKLAQKDKLASFKLNAAVVKKKTEDKVKAQMLSRYYDEAYKLFTDKGPYDFLSRREIITDYDFEDLKLAGAELEARTLSEFSRNYYNYKMIVESVKAGNGFTKEGLDLFLRSINSAAVYSAEITAKDFVKGYSGLDFFNMWILEDYGYLKKIENGELIELYIKTANELSREMAIVMVPAEYGRMPCSLMDESSFDIANGFSSFKNYTVEQIGGLKTNAFISLEKLKLDLQNIESAMSLRGML